MVRVRFAPSPTGELHLGSARTALYNYLFARQQGGKFIIRLEDTDRERLVAGSLERILADLAWLGLKWDEGPDVGGPYAPYVQSQRLELYQKHADDLIKRGAAYDCFCTAQRLAVLRQVQQAEGQITTYDRTCLKLTPAEIATKLAAKLPHTVRLKVPASAIIFHDLIRGEVKFDHASIDDSILLKSDGYPTYHLANAVDDHLMEITHVIRGEEWLPSTPKHLLIYQGFGWTPPTFAHLPNVLNAKKAKLSKRRDGEAAWLSTYRQQGYLAHAIVNALALLGWHPQDNRELFSLTELEHIFSLERVQKAGAIFDLAKLDWFNSEYIRQIPPAELDRLLQPYYQELPASPGAGGSTEQLTVLLQDRLTRLAAVREHAQWFFTPPEKSTVDIIVPKNSTAAKTLQALSSAYQALQRLTDWQATAIKNTLEVLVRPGTFSRADLLWPIRVALTGARQSADVFGVAGVLGQTETLKRLTQAQTWLTP